MHKQHYSKHSSRERRKKEERKRALEQQGDTQARVADVLLLGAAAHHNPHPPPPPHRSRGTEEGDKEEGKEARAEAVEQILRNMTTNLASALRINRKADFGVVKLCSLPLDDLVVDSQISVEVALPVPIQSPITLLACACLLGGRDAIVAALIRCGADPSKRCVPRGGGGQWRSSGPRARFVMQLPLAYAVWLVNRVVRMRLQQADAINMDNCVTSASDASPPAACSLCGGRGEDLLPLLRWPECEHLCCEDCLWTALSSDIDMQMGDCPCPSCFIAAGQLSQRFAEDSDNVDEVVLCRRGDRKRYVIAHRDIYPSIDAEIRKRESKERWNALPMSGGDADTSGDSKKMKTKTPRKERCNFGGMPMKELWRKNLGYTKETRQAVLFKAATDGDIGRLAALVEAGVDIDGENEYGQTALHTAAFYGNFEFVFDLIILYGAKWSARDSSGCDIALIARGADGIAVQPSADFESISMLCTRLAQSEAESYQNPNSCSLYCSFPANASLNDGAIGVIFRTFGGKLGVDTFEEGCAVAVVTAAVDDCVAHVLVPALRTGRDHECAPVYCNHPGSGSFYVDGMFSEEFLSMLTATHGGIPAAPPNKESCSSRTYFFDAARVAARGIEAALKRVLSAAVDSSTCVDDGSGVDSVVVAVLPGMRYLHYENAGGSLPAHVDLAKKDAISEKDSTHTFVLYLSDCEEGGETVLLDCLRAPKCDSHEPDMSKRTDDDLRAGIPANLLEGRKVISAVQPRRGRLLIFPHLCPHLGNVVKTPPKLLLRGELCIRRDPLLLSPSPRIVTDEIDP